jgi:hypothetical protein
VNTDDHTRPSPESLAAYLDGELAPCERATFERWLAENPNRRAELSSHRQLSRLCEITRPAEPDDETWPAVLAGISDRLPAHAVAHTRRRFPLRWLAGIAAAAAAFALIWNVAGRKGPPVPAPSPERELVDLPFAVASPDDVDITSLSNADDDVVLLGRPPLEGALILADPGDVRIEDMNPRQGLDIKFPDGPGEPPMIDIQPGAPKEN